MYLYYITAPVLINPCSPSPCGPNSQCKEINSQAVCSCLSGYVSSPPTCRPECLSSSECSLDQACLNQRCVNPCLGTCGLSAKCQVVNHNPICSCPNRYSGDPFIRCTPIGNCIFYPAQRTATINFIYFSGRISN